MDYANIILEMLDRIKTLEQEVAVLKNAQSNAVSQSVPTTIDGSLSKAKNYAVRDMSANRRDTTRYLFEGNIYLKNRLVLAVVKAYVERHNSITRQELKRVFGKSLQGSIGVVENAETAPVVRSDYQVRFFTRPQDVIHLIDGDMYVCTQWGIGNINNFIQRAIELDFKIETI